MKNKKRITRDEFLENDHLLFLNMAVQVINAEIQWSYDRSLKHPVSNKWLNGYILGLSQAKQLLISATKEIYDAG